MRERGGGVIVNISSIAAKKGGPNVYGASKAALESFTRSADRDWAPDNIRCVAIAPGMIDTEMEAEVIGDPARIGPLIETTARGRVAQPAEVGAAGEVAAAAVFLGVSGGRLHQRHRARR